MGTGVVPDQHAQKVTVLSDRVNEPAESLGAPDVVGPPKKEQLTLDWKDTQLGPGFPNPIQSAWADLGVMATGHVIRVEADGFNGKDGPIAVWGWYMNIWSGDGRNWVTLKGSKEPSRF